MFLVRVAEMLFETGTKTAATNASSVRSIRGTGSIVPAIFPQVYWGVIAAALGYCYFKAEETDGIVLVLATTLVILSAIPLFIYLRFPEKHSVIPVFAFNSLYYGLAFGIVSFFSFERKFEPFREVGKLQFALGIVALGVMSQMIGYKLISIRLLQKRQVLRKSMELTQEELRVIGWVFCAGALIAMAFVDILRIPTFGQLIRLFSLAGPSILFYMFLKRKLTLFEAVLFFTTTFYLVWQGFLTGSFAEGLRFGLILSLVALVSKRFYIFVVLVVVFGSLLFLINPIKMQYRSRTWFSNDGGQLTSFEKSEILIDCIVRHWGSNREDVSFVTGNKGTIDRLNQMGLFLAVVSKTPSSVPYWYGETIYDIIPSMVPRILWPGKPIKRFGNDFGHRYGLLHHRDKATSLNLPWVVELYANFGSIGILVGMFVIGLAFGYIENVLLNRDVETGTEVLLIGLFAPLSFPESNISLLWGGIILGWIAILATAKIFKVLDLFQRRRFERRIARLKYSERSRQKI